MAAGRSVNDTACNQRLCIMATMMQMFQDITSSNYRSNNLETSSVKVVYALQIHSIPVYIFIYWYAMSLLKMQFHSKQKGKHT